MPRLMKITLALHLTIFTTKMSYTYNNYYTKRVSKKRESLLFICLTHFSRDNSCGKCVMVRLGHPTLTVLGSSTHIHCMFPLNTAYSNYFTPPHQTPCSSGS